MNNKKDLIEDKQLTASEIEKITEEILKYKQQTAQNIIEIGKRLTKVKESLKHGDFTKWLEEKVDYTPKTAQKFMKIYKVFGKTKAPSFLSSEKLYLLTNLPEKDREDFINSNDVEKISVRELQEKIKVIKKSKIEKTVEEDTLEELKKKRKNIIEKRLELVRENTKKYQEINIKIDEICEEKGLYDQLEFTVTLSEMLANTHCFLQTHLAPFMYSRAMQHIDNPVVRQNLLDIVNLVEDWTKEMKTKLSKHEYNNEDIIDADVKEVLIDEK